MFDSDDHKNALILTNEKNKYAPLTNPEEKDILRMAAGDYACGYGTAMPEGTIDKAINILGRVSAAIKAAEQTIK